MKYFLAVSTRLLLISLVIFSCVKWFSFNQLSANLDADEVVWVLDAQVYEKYRKGEWNFFSVSRESLKTEWYQPEYRIIDQPQAGKYILGFFLELAGHQPWKSEAKNKLYQDFAKMQLLSGPLENLSQTLDSPVYESIVFIRYLHSFFGFLLIIFFSVVVKFVSKNIEAAMVFFVLLINHSGFSNQIRLATVDIYAFLFQLLAVIVFFLSLHTLQNKRKNMFLAILAGFLTAVATSIKLNGAFLTLGPYLVLLIKMSNIFFTNRKISQSDMSQIKTIFTWFVVFIISGSLFFILLEPELWSSPLQNSSILLDARLQQQQRFLQYFNDLSPLQIALKICDSALQQPWFVVLISLLVVTKNKTKNFEHFPIFKVASVIKQQQLFIMLLIPIIGAVFYYGKVGFDRYFYFAVINIYLFLVVLLLSDSGEQQDVKKT